LRAEVEALLGWIADPPQLPTVVQAAMAHYQFEALHPYSDGNGRLGRLLIIVQLLRGAVIREPLLVVSPWFELRRDEYQEELLTLSCDGDWDRWIAFFAEGVAASAAASQRKVEDLVALQQQLREQVQRAGKRGAAERLAADLVGDPYLTGRDIAARYDLSRQGALSAIRTLVELGVLEDTGGVNFRNARVYRAPEVVRIVSS
jgi:Fic family protein